MSGRKFDVYGVADWPEDCDRQFPIFTAKEFPDEKAAEQAAFAEYDDQITVMVKEVK